MPHPRERTLLRYADGDVPERVRRAVARHLLKCDRCGAELEELSALRSSALAPPEPPEALLDRILSRRATADRVMLPASEPVPASAVRRSVIVAAAAVLIVGLIALFRWPAVDESVAYEVVEGVCAMNLETRGLLVASSFLIATACTQAPEAGPSEPALPTAALAANALHEGTWVYRVGGQRGPARAYKITNILRRIGTGDAEEWLSVSFQEDPDASGPGWQGETRADTVYYAPDGVTPLRRVRHTVRGGRERWALQTTFGPDSVRSISDYRGYGGVPPEERTAAARLPDDGAPTVPAAYDLGIEMLLRRLPLTDGWSGSLRMGPLGDGWFRRETLRVDGEETIEVPAGVFDCWRVTMTPPFAPYYPYRLWVSKDEHLLVRSVRGPEGYGTERVLESFTGVRE